MKTTKKIEINGYIVVIEHDDSDNSLYVGVFDELEDLIESIEITEDDNDDIDNLIDPTLN